MTHLLSLYEQEKKNSTVNKKFSSLDSYAINILIVYRKFKSQMMFYNKEIFLLIQKTYLGFN